MSALALLAAKSEYVSFGHFVPLEYGVWNTGSSQKAAVKLLHLGSPEALKRSQRTGAQFLYRLVDKEIFSMQSARFEKLGGLFFSGIFENHI